MEISLDYVLCDIKKCKYIKVFSFVCCSRIAIAFDLKFQIKFSTLHSWCLRWFGGFAYICEAECIDICRVFSLCQDCFFSFFSIFSLFQENKTN